MQIFKSLDIPDDARHIITNSIVYAITYKIPEIIRTNDLYSTNAARLFGYNFIFKDIADNLVGNFRTKYITRGAWTFLLIYEQMLGYTFTIMTEKNFKLLQKRLPARIHYLEALIAHNASYKAIEMQTMFDFPEFKRDASAVEQLRCHLLGNIANEVSNHFLVLFNYAFDKVESVVAILPTAEFGIAYKQDWSNLIDKPYNVNKTSKQEDKVEDEEPLVKLKPNKRIILTNDIDVSPVEPEFKNL